MVDPVSHRKRGGQLSASDLGGLWSRAARDRSRYRKSGRALNSCYVANCKTLEDAYALAALLNGPLVAAWLNTVAEPARGGYRRYMGWTMSLLPIPEDWNRAREKLAALGERGMAGDVPTREEMLNAALSAYRVRLDDIQPLLSWMVPCD